MEGIFWDIPGVGRLYVGSKVMYDQNIDLSINFRSADDLKRKHNVPDGAILTVGAVSGVGNEYRKLLALFYNGERFIVMNSESKNSSARHLIIIDEDFVNWGRLHYKHQKRPKSL